MSDFIVTIGVTKASSPPPEGCNSIDEEGECRRYKKYCYWSDRNKQEVKKGDWDTVNHGDISRSCILAKCAPWTCMSFLEKRPECQSASILDCGIMPLYQYWCKKEGTNCEPKKRPDADDGETNDPLCEILRQIKIYMHSIFFLNLFHKIMKID